LILLDGEKQGLGKVLSRGELKHKVFFKNVFASKKAVEKIKALGGKIEVKEGKGREEVSVEDLEKAETVSAEAKPESAGEKGGKGE
jgi:hypothetical protein